MKSFFNKKNCLAIASILLTYLVFFVLISTGIINRYYSGIILLVLINITLTVSLNLVVGFTGQLCLGHAGFMALGAYTSAMLSVKLGLPLFVGIIVGGIVAGLFALLIGFPTLKLKGDYFAIATLAFGEIIRVILMNIPAVGGAKGLAGIPSSTNFTTAFIFLVITILVIYNVLHSSQGRAIISIRENEIAAEAMGVNTFKYKMIAFIIAAFFAGGAGALYAHYVGYIQPVNFDFMMSIDVLTFVVFGGMGSLSGSILSATLLTVLPEALRGFQEFRMILYPIALILLMIFRPQGLLGNKELSLKVFSKFTKTKEKEV